VERCLCERGGMRGKGGGGVRMGGTVHGIPRKAAAAEITMDRFHTG
jgi:hypothetical protein